MDDRIDSSGNVVVALVVALSVIVVGTLSYILINNKNKIATSPQSSTLTTVNPVTMKTYHNQILGFSFSYPSDWGEVKENIVDVVKANQGTKGKSYYLEFTNSTLVGVSGRSLDFEAPRGGMWSDYRGDPGEQKGVYSEIYNGAVGCDHMNIYRAFAGYIKFNLPGKEISGVILQYEILSADDFNTYVTKRLFSGGQCLDSSSSASKLLYGNAQAEDEKIINKIKSGELDKTTTNNYLLFDKIAKSAKVD